MSLPEIDPSIYYVEESGIEPELKDSVHSRAQEPDTVSSFEASMNTEPMLLYALLNDTKMVQALVDNGCLCFGIFDDKLAEKLRLPRIPIVLSLLETAQNTLTNKPTVGKVTFISLDLDGHITPKLWLYIVSQSTHQLILGKRWLEDQDAVIHSKEQRLELRKCGGSVHSVDQWRSGEFSTRGQNKATRLYNERNAEEIIELVPPVSLYPISSIKPNFNTSQTFDLAAKVISFEGDELQAHCAKGIEMENYWKRVRDAVGDGKRSLPQDIALKHRDNISGCMVVADRVLRG